MFLSGSLAVLSGAAPPQDLTISSFSLAAIQK
jgi:hypothetical protein